MAHRFVIDFSRGISNHDCRFAFDDVRRQRLGIEKKSN